MLRFNLTFMSRFISVLFIAFLAVSASAQGSSFTFQGKLNDNNLPANGTYEMQFRLLDNGGNQVSATNTVNNVSVVNGIFTVRLTFGIPAFNGNPQFLEISVRPAGSQNQFTVLNPPQSILSAPYSIRSLTSGTADLAATATLANNSNQLGGIAANQYVQTNDSRLSDDRDPLPGSTNYIQNTTVQQSTSNFNISGTGRATVFNAVTQFNLNNTRVLSNPGTNNLFAGAGSGTNNSTGNGNAFFGSLSGQANTTGINNAFFGFNAGTANNGGGANTFIGVNAGIANVGSSNNTFLGANAGNSNLTGNGNTYLGANSDGGFLITNSVAIGQKAFVGQSNALVLGSINGINGATADMDIGIGTTTPLARFHVVGNSFFSGRLGIGTSTPQTDFHVVNSQNSTFPLLVESNANKVGLQLRSTFFGGQARNWSIETNALSSGGFGIMAFKDSAFNSVPMELHTSTTGNSVLFVDGNIGLELSTGGQTSVCTTNGTSGFLATCSSSLRYKKDIEPFTRGLSLLYQLNPILFRWKSNDLPDLGFGAEDVAAVEPLLTTTNSEGQVEGVKYDRISAVLVNAVKEQQKQIEQQQKQIDELKAIVCSLKPDSAVCAKVQ